MTSKKRWGFCFAAILSLSACGDDDAPAVCVPGVSVACVGAGGCQGGQICNPEGTGFGECGCALEGDAGVADSGPPDARMDSTMADGGPADGSTDIVATDALDAAGFQSCSPLDDTPCVAPERCSVFVDEDERLNSVCAPPGPASVGDDCTLRRDGPDDCDRGLVCVATAPASPQNHCIEFCDPAGPDSCTYYPCQEVFDDGDLEIGLCILPPACDPTTQLPCLAEERCTIVRPGTMGNSRFYCLDRDGATAALDETCVLGTSLALPDNCEAGLNCDFEVLMCRPWCNSAVPCVDGSFCSMFGGTEFGVCTPPDE